jgi:hypothetical protein
MRLLLGPRRDDLQNDQARRAVLGSLPTIELVMLWKSVTARAHRDEARELLLAEFRRRDPETFAAWVRDGLGDDGAAAFVRPHHR